MSPETAINIVARRIVANRGEPRVTGISADDWQQVKQRREELNDEIRATYAPDETDLETALDLLHRRGKESRQP